MKRYRFDFPPGSAKAGCTVCGRVFMSAAGFDTHRGIKPQGRRGEEAQDLGRCMSVAEMKRRGVTETPHGWGTAAELARAEKGASLAAQRYQRTG